jgi:2-polyprenyl-3-methyl-5-hydroxy-6-metoxy-1,4-benzoquinol methylase
MGVFNGWFGTSWYGMLYRHRDEQDASAMAIPVISKGKLQAGMEVLDMACGRGRHAAIFAREGLRVTGLDLSAECIEEASRTTPQAHFEVFDMRQSYAKDRFDAVVCLFTSLGYSDNRKDDDMAVAAAASALKPSGLYVLDLLNGEYAAKNLVPLENKKMGHVEFELRRSWEKDAIVKQITVVHPTGQEVFQERVHAWNVDEVRAMVARNGLKITEITDGNCYSPFDRQLSDRMVVWARKTA